MMDENDDLIFDTLRQRNTMKDEVGGLVIGCLYGFLGGYLAYMAVWVGGVDGWVVQRLRGMVYI